MAILDFTSEFLESRLAWALGLASLVGLAGAGDTGDTVGMAPGSCSTMAPGHLTAGLSPIEASITPAFVAVGSTVEDFTAADFMEREGFTAALILERSAASIMEGLPGAFLLAARRVSAEDFTGVSTAAEVVEGNSPR